MIKEKDENNLIYSFSAANIIPFKIFLNKEIIYSCIEKTRVPSFHYQLNLTNKCNFSCLFCSCQARDRKQELTLDDIKFITEVGLKHGFKSATITGGGEPTLHNDFNEIITYLNKNGINIGLVTNGSNLLNIDGLEKLTWIRISTSDILPMELKKIGISIDEYLNSIYKSVIENSFVDWAFSYVLGEKPNISLIKRLIQFSNINNFTHVRIVNDILNAEHLAEQMKYLIKEIKKSKIDDKKVNYQDRSKWVKGVNPCYISILKPVIGADGYIYPCCGTQYALENPSLDYEKLMRMGHIKELDKILGEQTFFNGSMCKKCYYENYNHVLNVILNGLKHKTFV